MNRDDLAVCLDVYPQTLSGLSSTASALEGSALDCSMQAPRLYEL